MKKIRVTVDKKGRVMYGGIYPGRFGHYSLDIAQSRTYYSGKRGNLRWRTQFDDSFYVLEGSGVVQVLTSKQVKAHPDYQGGQ